MHGEDLPLVQNKIIQLEQLLVIREGEPAYNPAMDRVEPAACEMLKIQGKAGSWECLFYDAAQKSCSIHDNRPLECRLLQCQDTSAILVVSGQDCLTRRDLIGGDAPIVPYLEAFATCSWVKVNELQTSLTPESIKEAEKILRTDLILREQAIRELQLSLAQEFFYFGRPMFQSWNDPRVQLSFENGMPRLQAKPTVDFSAT